MGDAVQMADWKNALQRARAHSPFLCRALDRQPDLEELLRRGDWDKAIDHARTAASGVEDTARALRREKLALGTALAIADLAGELPVDTVMAELSDFADRALECAIGAAIARRVPDETPAGFCALALGKHGARELNYSSDIDPILLYDPDTLPRRERDEPGDAAQRYAREIVRLLSDSNADGYVFRVDLRLRPASEISPLAISFDTALMHYESSALTWERAAFIRARAAAGDHAAGQEFLDSIAPFVWRRSLDFGAISEIGRLTSRIRDAYGGPASPAPGYNVKQGRGGIREIEFFAQTHQLIHGGRNPALRMSGTKDALAALRDAGIVTADDARVLSDAYDRLRVIEHRLQMVEDQQTHSLPDQPGIDNVAQLGGYRDGAALLRDLTGITDAVASRFDTLIEPARKHGVRPNPASRTAQPDGTLADRLQDMGFDDSVALADRVRGWSDGRYRTLRSAAALDAFEAILPTALEAIAGAPNPDRAFNRWENLLENAPSAINLFRLLEARPGLFDQLIGVLTTADLLADKLTRHPSLIDTLIDRSALDLPGSVEELARIMALPAPLEPGTGDFERQLDRIRIVTKERRFALGVQLIEAAHDPLDIAEGLSRLAEAALLVAHRATCAEFAAVHGTVPGGELAVVGLGRLGGGALTHRSDLDIVYVFSGSHETRSDGERPLGATRYFNRLAQRVGAALSVPTAQGALYEVDTRLRPQGVQGPLAVSADSFERYQMNDAWTWEHMALNRARVLVGTPPVRAGIAQIIANVLNRPRDAGELRERVLAMRGEMAAHKPAAGPLDAKLRRGGLVDLEFLIHYLQLRDTIALTPDLTGAIAQLVDAGRLTRETIAAHALMTRLLISARLLAPDLHYPAPAAALRLAKACHCTDLPQLQARFDAARRDVAQQWQRIFDTKLEMDE